MVEVVIKFLPRKTIDYLNQPMLGKMLKRTRIASATAAMTAHQSNASPNRVAAIRSWVADASGGFGLSELMAEFLSVIELFTSNLMNAMPGVFKSDQGSCAEINGSTTAGTAEKWRFESNKRGHDTK
jgi:hypothetical protein